MFLMTYLGNNLLPEGLETGEFKTNAVANIDELKPVYVIAYMGDPQEDGFTESVPPAQGIIINGVPNGMYFAFCSQDMLQGVLSTINGAGKGQSILAVFSIPCLALNGFIRKFRYTTFTN